MYILKLLRCLVIRDLVIGCQGSSGFGARVLFAIERKHAISSLRGRILLI